MSKCFLISYLDKTHLNDFKCSTVRYNKRWCYFLYHVCPWIHQQILFFRPFPISWPTGCHDFHLGTIFQDIKISPGKNVLSLSGLCVVDFLWLSCMVGQRMDGEAVVISCHLGYVRPVAVWFNKMYMDYPRNTQDISQYFSASVISRNDVTSS